MKKLAVVSCLTVLAITMLLPMARAVNAESVNHANWVKSGPGPAPWLALGLPAGFVQAPSAKSGPGPAPWLALGSNF